MTDDLEAREMQRVAAVALAIAVCGYVCLSAICRWWPGVLITLLDRILPRELGFGSLALLGPPGAMLWGSELLEAYWWMTAILWIPVGFAFAGLRQERGEVVVVWGGVSLVAWMVCGLIAPVILGWGAG